MIETKALGPRTVIADFRQSGSLKLMFPRQTSATLPGILVNTAGGVTGGDTFKLHAQIAPETQLSLTTQAAERAYRSLDGVFGEIRSQIEVGADAHLTWLPQETILFEQCALRRRLSVDLEEGATALLTETLVLGREAVGETLSRARLSDRIELRRLGEPLFLDAIALDGDLTVKLQRPHGFAGHRALSTVLLVHPGAEAHLDAARKLAGSTGGASLLAPDVLIVRILAPDSLLLRRRLMPLLTRLSGTPLPRPWMI